MASVVPSTLSCQQKQLRLPNICRRQNSWGRPRSSTTRRSPTSSTGWEFSSRPPEQAIRILIDSIQPEMACYALRDGRVVGVAGMQYRGRRFYVVPWPIWRREFGLLGGLRRWLWFRLGQLFVHPAADALRVDGIAVAVAARGLGVGTQLMSALDAHARAAGCGLWNWRSWTPTPTRSGSMSGWGMSSLRKHTMAA